MKKIKPSTSRAKKMAQARRVMFGMGLPPLANNTKRFGSHRLSRSSLVFGIPRQAKEVLAKVSTCFTPEECNIIASLDRSFRTPEECHVLRRTEFNTEFNGQKNN